MTAAYWLLGILLWIFYAGVLIDWLGSIIGLAIAIFVAPGLLIFPAVFWAVTGDFPGLYFALWGGGIVAYFAVAILTGLEGNLLARQPVSDWGESIQEADGEDISPDREW